MLQILILQSSKHEIKLLTRKTRYALCKIIVYSNLLISPMCVYKIADFGMARDVSENYYVRPESKIPVKWTAPEVNGVLFHVN